jgi:hypothetical protein
MPFNQPSSAEPVYVSSWEYNELAPPARAPSSYDSYGASTAAAADPVWVKEQQNIKRREEENWRARLLEHKAIAPSPQHQNLEKNRLNRLIKTYKNKTNKIIEKSVAMKFKKQEKDMKRIQEHQKMIHNSPWNAFFKKQNIIQPLESGWFERLSRKNFKNLTEDEQKYLDNILAKKMQKYTENDEKYLKDKGVLLKNNRGNIPNYASFIKLQREEAEKLQQSIEERKQRIADEQSWIPSWAPSYFQPSSTLNTLRASNRQKEKEKKGGRRTRKN